MSTDLAGLRLRRDAGMATVTGLVLVFTFTAAGMIWLSRDVNRSVSNRTAAQSIAFQAARSGAQQLVVESLRDGASVAIDLDAAERAALATAEELFEGYAVDGRVVDVDVALDGLVEVEVEIDDPAGDVRGVGAARPAVGAGP